MESLKDPSWLNKCPGAVGNAVYTSISSFDKSCSKQQYRAMQLGCLGDEPFRITRPYHFEAKVSFYAQ